MAAVQSVPQPSDPALNAVVGNVRWQSGSLTYSFPASVAAYETPYGPNGETTANFGAMSATQQTWTRIALQQFASVANLSFTELTGPSAGLATLRMALSDAPSTAWSYLPSPSPLGGDIWFNRSGGYYSNPVLGNYAYGTIVHEIGHALGLHHPHENAMPAAQDSLEFTVMTYRPYVGASTNTGYTNETWGFPQTLMMHDIAALQYMYGANWSTNSGNTTYSWSPSTGQMFVNGVGQVAPGGNRIFMTLWDGGGIDTYDFSTYATALSIDLQPGNWTTTASGQLAKLHWSGSQVARGNIANALQFNGDARSLIENANGGSAGDTIVGNAANNVLRGNGGNDVIHGLGGSDTAAFTGTFAQYTVTLGAGATTVRDGISGRDGTDTLHGVEFIAFSDRTVSLASLSNPEGALFEAGVDALPEFGRLAAGWSNQDQYPRFVADVNGDGRDDVVAFANLNVRVALGRADGTFRASHVAYEAGYTVLGGGWSSIEQSPRMLGDINGDGRADLVAFSNVNIRVSLGGGDGTFAAGHVAYSSGYTLDRGGWSSLDRSPRMLGDINGDGRDDLVAFSSHNIRVALGRTDGTFADDHIAYSSGFTLQRGGWASQDQSPRLLGDVNGDGRDDLVAFANQNVWVALGRADGTFADGHIGFTGGFTADRGGWTSQSEYPRLLADVNGDGRADIVGFGASGTFVALGRANGTFAAAVEGIANFGTAAGWVSSLTLPRTTGDVNGDGRDDLIAFGDDGPVVALAKGGAAGAAGFAPDLYADAAQGAVQPHAVGVTHAAAAWDGSDDAMPAYLEQPSEFMY